MLSSLSRRLHLSSASSKENKQDCHDSLEHVQKLEALLATAATAGTVNAGGEDPLAALAGSSDLPVPVTLAVVGGQGQEELEFLLRRYLRAEKGDVEAAHQRLLAQAAWRAHIGAVTEGQVPGCIQANKALLQLPPPPPAGGGGAGGRRPVVVVVGRRHLPGAVQVQAVMSACVCELPFYYLQCNVLHPPPSPLPCAHAGDMVELERFVTWVLDTASSYCGCGGDSGGEGDDGSPDGQLAAVFDLRSERGARGEWRWQLRVAAAPVEGVCACVLCRCRRGCAAADRRRERGFPAASALSHP